MCAGWWRLSEVKAGKLIALLRVVPAAMLKLVADPIPPPIRCLFDRRSQALAHLYGAQVPYILSLAKTGRPLSILVFRATNHLHYVGLPALRSPLRSGFTFRLARSEGAEIPAWPRHVLEAFAELSVRSAHCSAAGQYLRFDRPPDPAGSIAGGALVADPELCTEEAVGLAFWQVISLSADELRLIGGERFRQFWQHLLAANPLYIRPLARSS